MEEIPGKIEIEVTASDVKYNSNLSLPEIVFWLETVKAMAIRDAVGSTE